MYQTQIIAFHEKSGTSVYSTPFQFNINKQDLRNFSLFKCTAEVYYYYDSKVDCLRSPGYQVCAVYSDGDIDDLPILSCTKMYSVSSVPPSIRDYFFVELIWPCADTVIERYVDWRTIAMNLKLSASTSTKTVKVLYSTQFSTFIITLVLHARFNFQVDINALQIHSFIHGSMDFSLSVSS